MKFKVGDKVRALGGHAYAGIPKGAEYVVTAADHSHIGFVCATLSEGYGDKIKDGTYTNWGIGNFELVEEMQKFKKGDKVRIVKDSRWYGTSSSNPKDEIGEIQSIYNTTYEDAMNITVKWPSYEHGNSYNEKDLELVDDTMNKYNIEEGDQYESATGVYTIKNVTATGFDVYNLRGEYACDFKFELFNEYLEQGTRKLLPKASKKITGYTLLKDTPELKAGTVVKLVEDEEEYFPNGDEDHETCYLPKFVENNTEWFSPIYEPVKPTEVVIDTLAGKTTVTKDKITLSNGDGITTKKAEEYMSKVKAWIHPNMLFTVKVETFKVGCTTFHVDDIAKLEEAIKQVS